MKSKPKINVLMSTYNGEKYVEEQVKSVLDQVDVDVTLQIRDDGSTDNTVEKISSFKLQNIRLLKSENVGWKRSFWELINSANTKYDYYAFADQDDVWEQDKLQRAIELLKSNEAYVYISNLEDVDRNLQPIGLKYSPNFKPQQTMPSAFFEGIGTGATIVFTKAFLEILHQHKVHENISHDAYVVALARFLSDRGVIYDSESRILYRNHETNATGLASNQKSKHSLSDYYSRYKKNKVKPFSERAKEILEGYKDQLSEEKIRDLTIISTSNENLKSRFRILFNPSFNLRNLRKTLQLKFRTIMKEL
jgi:glycosyltransferase involved in cell wall biosynthesis